MFQNSQPPTLKPSEKPFLVELWEEDRQPGGSFTPAAALHLTASLRTSGLLGTLSPDDLKSLIFLLTFVSPEGHCQVFLSQLAEAMRVSPTKAKARMRRLCDVQWKGNPVVVYLKSATGLTAFGMNPRVVTYQQRPEVQEPEQRPYIAAPRAAVIAHSRKHYARPRAEVERMVARQMGQDLDETDEERKIRYRLENAGLTGEQAKELLREYDLDTIARQLDWLPFRHAKNPAGYLIAAIEGNYGEPRAIREARIAREQEYGELRQEDGELPDEELQQQNLDDELTTGTSSSLIDSESLQMETFASETPYDDSPLGLSDSVDLPLPAEAENTSVDAPDYHEPEQ